MTGFSGGGSSAFSCSDGFRLAPDFLPVFPLSKLSSARSTVPMEGSSSTSLVRPFFPAFRLPRDAGVLQASAAADPEAAAEGREPGSWGSEEQRSLFRSCSLTKSCSLLLPPAHLRDRPDSVTRCEASQQHRRNVGECTLMADELRGPLSALVFHESLQGQKISEWT